MAEGVLRGKEGKSEKSSEDSPRAEAGFGLAGPGQCGTGIGPENGRAIWAADFGIKDTGKKVDSIMAGDFG